MKDIQIFNNPEFGQVRTVVIDDEPWFVAADVCRALDIGNSRQAVTRLDDDEKNTVTLNDGIPGNPEKTVVNEPGLYSLVLGSRKPEAKAFKRWITHEVIPAIRKTGGYHVPQSPEEQMAQGLLAAQKLLAEKDKRIEEMRPKEIFADAVSISKTDILIGDLAKLIKQNGHDIGQKRLFAWLREKGYLIKRKGLDWNMPTQKAMEMKLFRVKETVVTHSDGHTTVSKTPKVTGKGQVYFVNKFLAASKALN
ncbi:MAG: phage antirepressor [Anaerovibrio sp.]|uniref:phage antirepressor n=1 Tax=Anaerovibrio sp. TaxID=1872532 RepID=UPI00262DD2A4|nr:phage antirepressor [Anaerovibrio sp.]MDD7678136.1 phage antirepressor [Anaerovibrio sp.]MDY2603320.1 phage antirepressor [Anaerovibrio sp.]